MSTVKIAGTERLLRDADAPWIRQAIEASARIGELTLRARLYPNRECQYEPADPQLRRRDRGGGRPPNPEEEEILRLWNREGLNSARFTARQVTDFVDHVRRILRSSRHRSRRSATVPSTQMPSLGRGSDGPNQKR